MLLKSCAHWNTQVHNCKKNLNFFPNREFRKNFRKLTVKFSLFNVKFCRKGARTETIKCTIAQKLKIIFMLSLNLCISLTSACTKKWISCFLFKILLVIDVIFRIQRKQLLPSLKTSANIQLNILLLY